MKKLKYILEDLRWLKVLNSPFKPFSVTWYIGKTQVGTPYFLPRKWVKATPALATEAALNEIRSAKEWNERNRDSTFKHRVKSFEEAYKEKLKTLLFTPGKPVKGVPLISDKTAIFSPDLAKYYQYSFYYATYQGDIPVYYFKCKLKEGISWWNKDDTMIKELTTIFDAKNMKILGRYIDMAYASLPFNFHVKMNIELSYLNEEILVPTHISYDGDWDIPFKKREICTFDIKHYNFN